VHCAEGLELGGRERASERRRQGGRERQWCHSRSLPTPALFRTTKEPSSVRYEI
jgi:hypothetical protein